MCPNAGITNSDAATCMYITACCYVTACMLPAMLLHACYVTACMLLAMLLHACCYSYVTVCCYMLLCYCMHAASYMLAMLLHVWFPRSRVPPVHGLVHILVSVGSQDNHTTVLLNLKGSIEQCMCSYSIYSS